MDYIVHHYACKSFAVTSIAHEASCKIFHFFLPFLLDFEQYNIIKYLISQQFFHCAVSIQSSELFLLLNI